MGEKLDILLLFPPVWSPVMPFLALPTLTAYLKGKGVKVSQVDLSLEFFVNYILRREFLEDVLIKIQRHYDSISKGPLPTIFKKRLSRFKKNENELLDVINNLHNDKTILRDKIAFFDPEQCIIAQNRLYRALEFVSIANYPLTLTFNTLANKNVRDFKSLFEFFQSEINIFEVFYEKFLPKVIEVTMPGIVGISISTSHQMIPGLFLGHWLRRRYGNISIAMGGRHMERLVQAFKSEPQQISRFCDLVVMGDGEIPLEIAVEMRQKGGDLYQVPGTLWPGSGSGLGAQLSPFVEIGKRPIPDFDDIPFDQYLSPWSLIPIRFSEGCYWGKCTFCSRFDNRRYKTLHHETAVEALEGLSKRHDTSFFMINDDCLPPTYLEAVSREILRRGLKLNICLWAKPVSTFSRERIRELSRAGVRLIRWGIETGNKRVLLLMNKGTNISDTMKVLGYSHEAGIWNHAMIIFGFPTESISEARETISFLERNAESIHSSIFFKFSLLHNSHIFNNPNLYSIEEISAPSCIFSSDYNFRCKEGMSQQDLDEFMSWANDYRLKEIYGYPLWYFQRIREYLFLYLSKFSVKEIIGFKVLPQSLKVYQAGEMVEFRFVEGKDLDEDTLSKIRRLISLGGEVGLSWVEENLKEALWVGIAEENGRIVGTMTHKVPKAKYLGYLLKKTGLDLSNYVERGYSFVRPEYRSKGIGDRLLKGLVNRTGGRKIYVTIRLDNLSAIRLTQKNHMFLKASFKNERTGHDIGIFVNG